MLESGQRAEIERSESGSATERTVAHEGIICGRLGLASSVHQHLH